MGTQYGLFSMVGSSESARQLIPVGQAPSMKYPSEDLHLICVEVQEIPLSELARQTSPAAHYKLP